MTAASIGIHHATYVAPQRSAGRFAAAPKGISAAPVFTPKSRERVQQPAVPGKGHGDFLGQELRGSLHGHRGASPPGNGATDGVKIFTADHRPVAERGENPHVDLQ